LLPTEQRKATEEENIVFSALMIGLLQRVQQAQVSVEGQVVGVIGRGLLVLVGVERGDDKAQAQRLLERLLGYRVFPDARGRMNLSLRDVEGGLLLVPQFTLVVDTRKGMRPSFTPAASPQEAEAMFDYLFSRARLLYPHTATGRFGAPMLVSLINDGPVTFSLRVPPASRSFAEESAAVGVTICQPCRQKGACSI
jgi:D-tyrosyl-tRNA(Tyr) deacylase